MNKIPKIKTTMQIFIRTPIKLWTNVLNSCLTTPDGLASLIAII
jgi:hypothetical protein